MIFFQILMTWKVRYYLILQKWAPTTTQRQVMKTAILFIVILPSLVPNVPNNISASLYVVSSTLCFVLYSYQYIFFKLNDGMTFSAVPFLF